MLNETIVRMFIKGFGESLYMTFFSAFFAYLFGLPLGILLIITSKEGIFPLNGFHKILGVVINLARSVPFLILLVALTPLTRAITGTTIGAKATVVPLVISAAPFIARLVESSIQEIDKGIIEAAWSMGSSPWQIIYKVLIPEAKPSLITGSAIAITTILGYSAMAGFVGGGGLGTIAINYGYYRYQTDIMLVSVALLVMIVQLLQETGMRLAKKSDKRL